jgi:Ca2+-binding RTX toxin-like protein
VGSLNQIRRALLSSDDPYVMEAVDRAGDLSPYLNWTDFKTRNGLSDELLAKFVTAYPDLVLPDQAAIDAFVATNPDIPIYGGNTVRGIDRVDLIVGGLAEAHLDKAMVGQTFWVILHEQLDRVQEGDRFHYVDRLVGTGILGQLRAGPEAGLAAIVARNTGIELTPGPFFIAGGAGGGGGVAPDIIAPIVADFVPSAGAIDVSRSANLVLSFSETILRGTGTLEIRRVSDNHVVERFDVATSDRITITDRVLTVDPVVTLAGGTAYEIRVGAGAIKDVASNLIAPIEGHVFRTEYVFVGSGRGDALTGTSHADTLRGLAGNDFLEGRGGHDLLDGGPGADFMRGSAGNDTYWVDSTSDRVAEVAGEGIDTIKTALSSYVIRPHFEVLEYTGDASFRGIGNAMDNRIHGGSGADRLEGGSGADTLNGGDGSDVLIGGRGRDVLVFDTAPKIGVVDHIDGFNASRDRVHLDGDAFLGLGAPGPLKSAVFVQGAATTSAAHRLLFNPVTSALAYDPDGVGGSAPIVFATLEGLTGSLTAAVFVII